MQGISKSDVSGITYNPHQENKKKENNEEVSQSRSASLITHRTCNLAEDIAGTRSVQAAKVLPDMPSVHLTKTFYQPKGEDPLIFGHNQFMTHGDYREMLSKHMDVYAVITDDVSGDGGVNILVFGKPKFKVNELKGMFFTPAFKAILSLNESPFSSDLIGFSLQSLCWIAHDLYVKLKTKSDNHEEMSSIEQSIFDKLHTKLSSGFGNVINIVCSEDFLTDTTPHEARFIFEQSFDASIEKIKEKQGSTPYENRLNSKATIEDLPEILRSYKDRMDWAGYNKWKLNYLDEALLANAKWE